MSDPLPCYPVVGAHGGRLELASGQTLIDGMSSWWSAIHGYNHPALNQTIKNQAEKMSHVMFGGLAHQPASELGARLIKLTPESFQHVFLADSGSISIEVALKMALQYWQSVGQKSKTKFLTVRGGYHGDPFCCMSVGDPENGQHHLFPHAIAPNYFVDRPKCRYDDDWDPIDFIPFEQTVTEQHDNIAAVIIEPIVQGAGGMHFYHPQYLKHIREICDEFGLLLIFDEIATGFGRTGTMFACEHADVQADIMCLGKALTGGMLTLAATLTSKKVAMGISTGDIPILMHGPTFMGNPLACSVACASIDLLIQDGLGSEYPRGWQSRVAKISNRLKDLLMLQDHLKVSDVRVLGAIGVVEMKTPVYIQKAQDLFVERGIWVRPFGKLIYVMPPYILSDEEVGFLCDSIAEVVQEL